MLVLSRKPDESIIITTPAGERIEVVVVEIHHDRYKVRLGVKAPRSVTINRREIQDLVDAKAKGGSGV